MAKILPEDQLAENFKDLVIRMDRFTSAQQYAPH